MDCSSKISSFCIASSAEYNEYVQLSTYKMVPIRRTGRTQKSMMSTTKTSNTMNTPHNM